MTPFTIGIFYAILTGVCWAVLAIGLKYALHFASTGTIVWVRMVVAFTCLAAYYLLRKPTTLVRVFRRPPKNILLAGLLLACNYFTYMRGLELTSASNAQIMIQLGPVLLLFIGVYYFREPLRWLQWIGLIAAGLGFLFFNWDQVLVAAQASDLYLRGNLWIVVASVTWAGFAMLQKLQLRQGWSPQMINLLVYAVCLVALFPLADLKELAPLDLWQWFVLFLCGLNTLVAYGAFAEAIERIPASYVSMIVAMNPILTIALMTLFGYLGVTFVSAEPILWRGYLGAFLVVAGVTAAVSLRPRSAPVKSRF